MNPSLRISLFLLCFLTQPAKSDAKASSLSGSQSTWAPQEGRQLIGTRAPEWESIRSLSGEPMRLDAFRGKVVLLRFWLVECPYCTRTLPVLQELWDRYRERGLAVVGLHHPKGDVEDEAVEGASRQLGLTFPIGMDDEWKTLRAYGQGTAFARFTSLTFLIDRKGIIRFVHDGGEFHPGGGPEHAACNAAYEALLATLHTLLEE